MKRYSLFSALMVTVLILSVVLAGCSGSTVTNNSLGDSLQGSEQQIVVSYYPRLRNSVPYPVEQMKYSLERANLRERLLRFNQPNKIGYVSLIYPMGGLAGYFTIKGKVSNPDSQLTTAQQATMWCPYSGGSNSAYCQFVVTDSPGDDGSYGPNEQGIFFFTTEDVLIETNLLYFYSDAPTRLNDQKLIVFDGAPKPSSVGEALGVRDARATSAEKQPVAPVQPPATPPSKNP